MTNNKLK